MAFKTIGDDIHEVLSFIKRRFPDDCNWTSGNCYYFALILKDRFRGDIYYDVIDGHFLTKIRGRFYDHTGEVDATDLTLVEWDKFNEYDEFQRERIWQDCIK